jgi:hypothetical protein
MGKQTMRQAASQAYAKRRHEGAQCDRRLEKLAIEVLTALGERDATIAATEQRAGAALQAMIIDESLTVSEAVQWCAGAINQREATRLRHLQRRPTTTRPRMTAPRPATFDDPAHLLCERVVSLDSCLHEMFCVQLRPSAS